MSYGGQTTVFTSSASYAAVTAWAATAAKTVGQLVRQLTTPAVGSERVYVCITAGTTAGSEPTWTTTRGAKQATDGSVVWQECTGVAGVNGDITDTPAWNNTDVKNQSISLGHIIKDVAGTHLFICTTAGSAGNGSEPSWSVGSLGATTTDNTVTWTYIGTSFTKWSAPHARFLNAMQTSWGTNSQGTDPRRFFIGSDHAETQASSITWRDLGTIAAPLDILCVDVAGSMPPVAADLATTATITTTGSSSAITLDSFIRMCYGITFIMASGGSNNITLNTGNTNQNERNYESCKFNVATTGSGAVIALGNSASNIGRTTLRNCTFKFASTGHTINTGGYNLLINCTVDGTGSLPSSNQLLTESTGGSETIWKQSDLSNLTNCRLSNNNGASTSRTMFVDCKLATGFLPYRANGGNFTSYEGILSRCSIGTEYTQFQLITTAGAINSDTTIYRGSGASENSVNFGWSLKTAASMPNFGSSPLKTPPIAIYNSTTGSNVTVTLYGLVNAAAVPNDIDVFMDVEYLGDASSTLGTNVSTRPASALTTPTALTADTSGWDGGATARANTHAYSVDDIIKTSSNSGRIFFCTSAGTSAGSEPGGYASAVDGGSVTDSGATFRAACRFKVTVTLSSPQPAVQGNLYVQPYVGNIRSTTYYIDPLPTLT